MLRLVLSLAYDLRWFRVSRREPATPGRRRAGGPARGGPVKARPGVMLLVILRPRLPSD